jgi:hypothetical protein
MIRPWSLGGRIVLLAAQGETNRTIAEIVGMHLQPRGIVAEALRGGGPRGRGAPGAPPPPPVYDHDNVLLLVKLVTSHRPTERPVGRLRLVGALAHHGVSVSDSQR